jgi:hypothetical protein
VQLPTSKDRYLNQPLRCLTVDIGSKNAGAGAIYPSNVQADNEDDKKDDEMVNAKSYFPYPDRCDYGPRDNVVFEPRIPATQDYFAFGIDSVRPELSLYTPPPLYPPTPTPCNSDFSDESLIFSFFDDAMFNSEDAKTDGSQFSATHLFESEIPDNRQNVPEHTESIPLDWLETHDEHQIIDSLLEYHRRNISPCHYFLYSDHDWLCTQSLFSRSQNSECLRYVLASFSALICYVGGESTAGELTFLYYGLGLTKFRELLRHLKLMGTKETEVALATALVLAAIEVLSI